jgi:hypothetical protein
MLVNKIQPLVAGLLGASIVGVFVATALPFNDRIEYKIGNKIESQPAWLVPPKAEFRSLERGYGGIKILLALLSTGGMFLTMLIARSEGEQEPVRQRIKQYKNRAYEFGFAAKSAYQMATTQNRYKKLVEADEVEFEGQIEQAYMESLGVDPNEQQPLLTGTATLDSVANPSDKVESVTAPAIGNASGLLHPSEAKAIAILRQVAGSRMSLLLIAGTGGGKTVTQACLISLLLEKCPNTEFWVISQKNDNYCGLKAKGRVTIFDINNLKETLDKIHHVWGIYNTRRHLDESQRKNLSPVRLLLADWLSINSALQEMASHPDVKNSNYLVELCDIGLNGRDFNVCFWADLQSFYLLAIGMKADSNIRQNFNLIGLGNYYTDEFGFVNDSYGVLANMIATHSIIENKGIRQTLLSEFNRLKSVSKTNERPIMLSTLEPPTVCLQADVRHYQKQHQIASEDDVPTGNASNASELTGTPSDAPGTDPPNPGTLYGTRAERISGMFEAIMAGTVEMAVFASESPLEPEEKMELAKLVIAQDLGIERTIWILWNIRRGGRNHDRYTDAREALERLIKGEQNNG